MECERAREALSALLDDEDPGIDRPLVDAHVASCAGCTTWMAGVAELHRAVRVRPAEEVPDLSAAIVGRVAPARRQPLLGREPVSVARWGLLVLALTQLVLAVPSLLGDADGSVHASRELGAFDVALAVGLLVAFWQPARAWGLLPLAGVLTVVLAGIAVLDVASGEAALLEETPHLLELAGAALLWRVAQEPGSQAGPVRRGRALA